MILSILSLLLFNLSINKDSGVYEKGERAVVSCHTDIVPTDSLFVSVSYNNKVGQEFRILPTSTDFTVLEQALDSTCAVSIEVKERSGASASIGYVVAPEGFRAGYEEPADLMDYWDNLKQQLKALPMQVKTRRWQYHSSIRTNSPVKTWRSTVSVLPPCEPMSPNP